jgi:hypothetical protein
MATNDLLSRPLKIFSPRIVAQAGPEPQQFLSVGPSQVFDGGEGFQKAKVVWNDSLHLSLLQHDFRNPHSIRILRPSPREITLLDRIPGQEFLSKTFFPFEA